MIKKLRIKKLIDSLKHGKTKETAADLIPKVKEFIDSLKHERTKETTADLIPMTKIPLTSLTKFLETERAALSKEFLEKEMASFLEENKIEDLLFSATSYLQLGVPRKNMDKSTAFILSSNLFFLREWVKNEENLTFGADPEFILCDQDNRKRTVLFSSKHTMPRNHGAGIFSMSELAVGADYGLLEIRPSYTVDSPALAANVRSLLDDFEEVQKKAKETQKQNPKSKVKKVKVETVAIQEVEAVYFAHKKQRLIEIMENGELDFGAGTDGKFNCVASAANSADLGLTAAELYGISISAYDKPVFAQGNDNVLTAGGHIHFGGRRVKIFNLAQLKELVKRFDKKLLPMVAKVETPAAELRRQFYGAPGEFRLKSYGIEYRSLSNALFWPKNLKVLEAVVKEAEDIILTFHKEVVVAA
jgi:hypothetical protein